MAAEAPDQFDAVDSDHFSIGQMVLENFNCPSIFFPVAIGGHQQGAVDEIEVDVGRGEPLAVINDRMGHWDFHNLKRFSQLIGQAFELLASVAKDRKIFILAIFLDGDDDFRGVMKRARSSTCPSVSSPAIPVVSQQTFFWP